MHRRIHVYQKNPLTKLRRLDRHWPLLRHRHHHRPGSHCHSPTYQQTPWSRRLAPNPGLHMPDRCHWPAPLRYPYRLPHRSHEFGSVGPFRQRRRWNRRHQHATDQDQLFCKIQLGIPDPDLDHYLRGKIRLLVFFQAAGEGLALYISILEVRCCCYGCRLCVFAR